MTFRRLRLMKFFHDHPVVFVGWQFPSASIAADSTGPSDIFHACPSVAPRVSRNGYVPSTYSLSAASSSGSVYAGSACPFAAYGACDGFSGLRRIRQRLGKLTHDFTAKILGWELMQIWLCFTWFEVFRPVGSCCALSEPLKCFRT